MSLSPNGGASDNQGSDCDSFHSFIQSDYERYSNKSELSASWKSSLSSDCDSATGFESEHETSGGTCEEYSIEPQASNETGPKVLPVIPKPKSAGQKSEYSSDSSACDGVSTNNGTLQPPMGRFKTPKKFVASPLSLAEEPLPMCPRKVSEPASKEMPSDDLFNLDLPQLRLKDYLISDPQKEAMEKLAFTEIWVGSQQQAVQTKRSPLRAFSAALDAYFQDLAKKKEENRIVQSMVEPASTTYASVKSDEEYVSPFKNMQVPAAPPKETSLLNEAKKPIIVPAGFDLTRLVEFKNPNHWHRRQHVRTGDRILF